MRLADKIVQGSVEQFYSGDPDRRHAVTGPGAFAEAVKACGLRYVLDRRASLQCAEIVRSEHLVPNVGDLLFRPPAESFWLELHSDDGERLGMLVEVDESGETGTLTPFGERSDGGVDFLQCVIWFDHGQRFGTPEYSPAMHRVRHADLPHVDALLGHARTRVDDRWLARCERLGRERSATIAHICEQTWVMLPAMTAFCALLNARDVTKQRPSDLGKLNAARARRGREALIDHIEVSLDLDGGSGAFERQAGAMNGLRMPPRLHIVRGHQVVRAGKSFWRSSHLRGDGQDLLRRTVTVTSSKRQPGALPRFIRPNAPTIRTG